MDGGATQASASDLSVDIGDAISVEESDSAGPGDLTAPGLPVKAGARGAPGGAGAGSGGGAPALPGPPHVEGKGTGGQEQQEQQKLEKQVGAGQGGDRATSLRVWRYQRQDAGILALGCLAALANGATMPGVHLSSVCVWGVRVCVCMECAQGTR